MDQDGNILAIHNGPRTVEGFEATAKTADEWAAKKKKAAAGDKQALVEVVLTELKDGRMKISEADAKLKDVSLSDEQKKEVESVRPDAEVRELSQEATPQDKTGAIALGKKFAERKKEGKAPPKDEQLVQMYWVLMMNYAESEKDAALYEDALTSLEKVFGSNPRAKRFFEAAHKTLEKLKEPKEPSEKK
jgi:hypothetical protein